MNEVAPTAATPILELHDVTFAHAAEAAAPCVPVLRHTSLAVPQGAFAVLAGPTGSGKTTILRLAMPGLAPAGELSGEVRVLGRDVADATFGNVAIVFQRPAEQVVCDTVRRELAFGLERQGLAQAELDLRLAQVCAFLGIEGWLGRKTSELSSGELQTLALASALVLAPRLLLLDEPTASLDPVAAANLVAQVARANRELGVTVLVATHAPWLFSAHATMALSLADGQAQEVPVEDVAARPALLASPSASPGTDTAEKGVPAREVSLMRGVWLRYGKGFPWVLRDCDLAVMPGRMRALVGSNGCGKTTLLRVVSGQLRPSRGRVMLPGSIAVLPQDPTLLFCAQTVREELVQWAGRDEGAQQAALARAEAMGLASDTLDRHPLDLSDGQRRILALAKLLATAPALLLLDEPTRGVDPEAAVVLCQHIASAAAGGASVLVATHDMALVRGIADDVSVLFDGRLLDPIPTDDFLAKGRLWGGSL